MTEEINPTADAVADTDPARGLAAVRALRTLADRLEDIHVDNARRAGWSWQQIAEILEISRQAVHQKHARRDEGDTPS
ncbi:helix-turn-helix domain-containing protein [Gordonia sp. X0973]|uniref:helix-turn-helix domain-containing protein n=1 Tax=Gordonia sp. X0973 TaxID=2742602 RepID=UPI000F525634|nr:helix-turn-helix domain-containing protein [Gordonia sp. X0973]QKT08390.1 helix-turn-helix domain-containing protein [Gordonia sp. X0973]